MNELQDYVDKKMREILANRERYLEAWIAETGLKPSESMVLETPGAQLGGAVVSVIERSPKQLDQEIQWRINDAYERGRVNEREACARIAEELHSSNARGGLSLVPRDLRIATDCASETIAEHIRGRGKS